MALEYIACYGCTISHQTTPPSLITGGAFVIDISPTTGNPPSIKVKTSGSGVFSGTIKFSFSGGDYAGCVPGSVHTVPTIQSVPASAVNVKADGSFVMREGDSITMTCEGTSSSTGNPVPCTGVVEVSDAGQDKVKAD